jgi:hypothetical protein
VDVSKYAQNIVTDTREYTPEELVKIEEMRRRSQVKSTVEATRLLWMDDTKVPGAEFYMECLWLWEGTTTSGTMEEPHQHDFAEVIGFIGSNPDSPHDLDGRIEIILGDEKHFLTKSSLVFIPPGMKHCPLTFREVGRPTFFFTLAPINRYGRTSEMMKPEVKASSIMPVFIPPEKDASGTRYGHGRSSDRYIFTEPRPHGPPRPKPEKPTAKTTQVVSLDGEAVSGGFYIDFVWIWSGNMTMSELHSHDFAEMIGIVGMPDRVNPRQIGGDVSIILGEEMQAITQSSIIYLTPGLNHCPLQFGNIVRPVLCFTIGNTPKWVLKKAST